MNRIRLSDCSYAAIAIVLLLTAPQLRAAIIYDVPDSLYQENFDSLPTTGQLLVFRQDSTLPGWSAFTGPTGTTPLNLLNANDGSSTILGLQSFGNSSERAFGSLHQLNSTQANIIALAINNSTTASLDSFTVTYDGEQWRKAQALAQTLVFAYGFGNSYATVSNWTPVPSLNFRSPAANLNPATAVNGNLAANRIANTAATISGLDWAADDTLWLRWVDAPESSSHGLAIDNFRFSASSISAVPEPSSILLLGVAGLGGMALRARKRVGALFSRRGK